MNQLQALHNYGQSIWLDSIRRSLIASGELQRMVEAGEIWGVTSNPVIFYQALTESTEYDFTLKCLEQSQDRDAMSLYEGLAIADIQIAADILLSVYVQTNKRDGYISLEVSPYLAHNTLGTINEARRLWLAIARNNLMIKIPATPAGIPAIKQLISEGINVNVTLLFAQDVYEEVAQAYITGLETLAARGGDVAQVASVASFSISQIDSSVDELITAQVENISDYNKRNFLKDLLGKTAIANAKLTYQSYLNIYQSDRWQTLARMGAQPQRLLWASTGAKNSQYNSLSYIEELIGNNTVNTVESTTLVAFREHGQTRRSLTENLEDAQEIIERLQQVNISLPEVAEQLLQKEVQLYTDTYDKLLSTVEYKRQEILGDELNPFTFTLSEELATSVHTSLEEWRINSKIRRLWEQDPSLWTGTDEDSWLGWLGITKDQLIHINRLKRLAEEIKELDFTHVLLLGMGGSSLCVQVIKSTFGQVIGFPELHILDSTDPTQIKAIERRIPLNKTLFIVSSKSGNTLESGIFKQYFFDRVQQLIGKKAAGAKFIAITDPGSKLERIARENFFRHVFRGIPSVGDRYSALSNFGMVPAAIMGIDVAKLLDIAQEMVHCCSPAVPAPDNPGVILGTILGVLANRGHDKVTFITSPGIMSLGAWLEQLLAESTGKDGKGLIPVDMEPLGPPHVYGNDRLFVYIRLTSDPDSEQDTTVKALEAAGHPVIQISVTDRYHLGQEFFRWELATAVAGSIMGINAFNQPDVEASKVATQKLTSIYENTGTLPHETYLVKELGIELFADPQNAEALTKAIKGGHPLGSWAVRHRSLAAYLRGHFDRLKAGDYFALLAYIEMNDRHQLQLQSIRQIIRDHYRVATCLGFGPRFLHSTGQAYKGGPNTGVFLQITCEDAVDLPVPGQRYSFGVIKAAQARGDFQILTERNRRALRVHLSRGATAGLITLQTLMHQIFRLNESN